MYYHSSENNAKSESLILLINPTQNLCCLVFYKVGSLLRYFFNAWLPPTTSSFAKYSNTPLNYSYFALGAVSLFCKYFYVIVYKIYFIINYTFINYP